MKTTTPPLNQLADALAKPYEDRNEFSAYEQAPKPDERVYQTFCGNVVPQADRRMFMQKIPYLKNKVVRDLAWSCFGPNLIDTFLPTQRQKSLPSGGIESLELDLTNGRIQWLLELDQNPESIFIHLSHLKSSRLGLYFEVLWHFFLRHDSQLELMAHNIPIRSDKRTLGEFRYCLS